MSDEKKYSFISVDTGSDSDTGEPSKVRTTRDVIDGEETFVVSSAPADESRNASAITEGTSNAAASKIGTPKEVTSENEIPRETTETAVPKIKASNNDESDEVPFQRMQTIIIISLAVLIVAFFLYFNFLR